MGRKMKSVCIFVGGVGAGWWEDSCMRHQLVPANTHSISLRERANKRNAALPPLPSETSSQKELHHRNIQLLTEVEQLSLPLTQILLFPDCVWFHAQVLSTQQPPQTSGFNL